MSQAGKNDKSVFISYRRTNQFFALAVYQNLTQHGYDVFMDFESIGSGDFEQVILANIRSRSHFLVLLTPTALDRCKDPKDWLRLEIETALDSKRNTVPLMFEGFDFGNPKISKKLTGKLSILKKYNALMIPATYFDEAMDRLRERFLDIPLNMVLHPVSKNALQFAKDQQTAASNAPVVKENELIAEEWFERGVYLDDMEERFRHMDEAIKLKPDYVAAYIFRGISQLALGNEEAGMEDLLMSAKFQPKDGWSFFGRGLSWEALNKPQNAIVEYDEAIRLEPGFTEFYIRKAEAQKVIDDLDGAQATFTNVINLDNDYRYYGYCERGQIRFDKGDIDGAVKDFTEAIPLYPDDPKAYILRARVLEEMENYKGAIEDCNQLIRLTPDVAEAFVERGRLRLYIDDCDGSLNDFNEAIRLKPEYIDAYYARATVLEIQGKYNDAITDFKKYLTLNGGNQNSNKHEVKKRIRKLSKKVG